MRIRFWGTRGSVAVPGPRTVRYGGNTSCVEVLPGDGTHLILDCGTGLRELGNDLMARTPRPGLLHVLLSHTHWDHIQGFPFFAPAFNTESHIVIHSAVGRDKHLDEVLAGQMEYTYFPVTLPQMGARIEIKELGRQPFDIGGVHISTHPMNHTTTCLGYRMEYQGVVVCFSTDHESYARFVRDRSPGARPQQRAEMTPSNLAYGQQAEAAYLDFVRNADLLITDAQYTEEEYQSHLGWGHSTCDDAVRAALAAGVRRLALYHHDPGHSDDMIDHILLHCRRMVEQAHGTVEVMAAAEQQVIDIPSRSQAPA